MLPAGRTAADYREASRGRRGDADRAPASFAAGRRRLRTGGDQFSGGGWPGLCESADESLLGSAAGRKQNARSEEHTSELQSQSNLVCRLLLEKKKKKRRCMSPATSHSTTYCNPRIDVLHYEAL